MAQEPQQILDIKTKLENVTSDSLRVNLLDDLAWEYIYYRPQDALPYANEALSVAKKIGFTKGEGRLYNTLGVINANTGEYSKALRQYQLALKVKRRINDKPGEASCLINIGNVFQFQSFYDSAIAYYFQGLATFETIGNKSNMATTYNNIAAVYELLNEYGRVLEYATKGLAMAEEIVDRPAVMNSKILMGSYHKWKGENQKALENYQEALKLATELNDDFGASNCYHNLAGVYLKLNKRKEAKEYYEKQLIVAGQLVSPNDSLYALLGLARVYMDDSAFDRSESNLQSAWTTAKRLNARNELMQTELLFSELWEKKKNYTRALNHVKAYMELKDSLFSEAKSKQIQDLTERYQAAQRDKEIEILQQKEEIKDASLARERWIRNAATVSLVVAIAIASLLFVIVKQRNKANKELTQQKQDLERVNLVKTRLFATISHDVRSPVVSLHNLLQLLKKDNLPDRAAFLQQADATVAGTLNLIDNLLYWSAEQTREMTLRSVEVNLRESADDSIALFEGIRTTKQVTISNNISGTAKADPSSLNLIFRNLISNAIKFCSPGGSIILSNEVVNENLIVSVSDSGPGIPPEDRSRLFTSRSELRQGTNNEAGTGLGLILCRDHVEKNGGKLWVEESSLGGACFKFSLPVFRLIENQENA